MKNKGAIPVPYIIALLLGICVVAILGYWFFVCEGDCTEDYDYTCVMKEDELGLCCSTDNHECIDCCPCLIEVVCKENNCIAECSKYVVADANWLSCMATCQTDSETTCSYRHAQTKEPCEIQYCWIHNEEYCFKAVDTDKPESWKQKLVCGDEVFDFPFSEAETPKTESLAKEELIKIQEFWDMKGEHICDEKQAFLDFYCEGY